MKTDLELNIKIDMVQIDDFEPHKIRSYPHRKEGGAMSERARLAKACRALRARKRALAHARETGTLSKSRPFTGGNDSGAPPGKRQKRSLWGEEQTVNDLGTIGGIGRSLNSPRFHPIDKRFGGE